MDAAHATTRTRSSATDGPDARDRMVRENLALVHHVASKMVRQRDVGAEYEDLVSAGSIGLIQAANNFDPKRGLAFSTYAAPRIRGAILDDLRRRDTMSRSVRSKQRQMSQARQTLARSAGRPVRDGEVAEVMGVGVDTYWKWEQEIERSRTVALDAPIDPSTPSAGSARDVVAGSDGCDILDAIDSQEKAEILQKELGQLKEQERTVLALYYLEGLKLAEIAPILGVTESRVSQIRTAALRRLRESLRRFAPGSD